MNWGFCLATLNAILNGAAAVLLFLGRRAILQKRVAAHRKYMVASLTVSGFFLASYLTRFYLTGVHRYEGTGWLRGIYFFILATHTPLAAAVPVLAGILVYYAARQKFTSHRRLARVAWPIWMYVSVTGVLIYFLLYHTSTVA